MSQSPPPVQFPPPPQKPFWTVGKIAAVVLVVLVVVSVVAAGAYYYGTRPPGPANPTPSPSCSNGATNYPSCNSCPSGQSFNNSACVANCSNGATNPTNCTVCPSGQTLYGGNCSNDCTNGAINPPICSKLTVLAEASPNPSIVGQSVTFSATVSGGVGPLTCYWNFGDGFAPVKDVGCSAVAHTYATAGNFAVNVEARGSLSSGMDSATDSLTQVVNNPTCPNGATNYPFCNEWTTSTTVTCMSPVLTSHYLNSTSCEIRVSSQAPTLPTGSVGVGATTTGTWHANNVPCSLTVFVGYSYCTITGVSASASGTLTLVANYAGDSTHESSMGSFSLTVVDPPSTVTVSGTAGVYGVGVAYQIDFVNTVTGVGYSTPVYNAGSGTSGTYSILLPNLATYSVTVYYSATTNGSTACGTLNLQSTTSTWAANYKC